MLKEMMLNEIRVQSNGQRIQAKASTYKCEGCCGCMEFEDNIVGPCDPRDRIDAHDVIFVKLDQKKVTKNEK